MRIGIPCEVQAGETRVALIPDLVPLLCRDGHGVLIEASAGVKAHVLDAQYTKVPTNCATRS